MTAVDTLEARYDNGIATAARFKTTISETAPPLDALSVLLPAVPARDHPGAIIDLWQASQVVVPHGITLTTSLCDEWRTFLRSDDVFMAVRAPVALPAFITQSQTLPVISGGAYSNTVQLVRTTTYPYSRLIAVPLELRPERLTFLANELPAAPGEAWMALGLISETTTCPTSLAIPSGEWGVQTLFCLDLTHRPNNCAGCVLPLYYCYEGQNPPPSFVGLYHVLGGDVTSYQGWGITCLGPLPLPLVDYAASGWELGGISTAAITPTQTLSFSHYLGNWAGQPMSFTLEYTAALPVAWGLYEDKLGQPDLSKPITLPIQTDGTGAYEFFWLVSGPVPAGTAAGNYALVITATNVASPTNSRWTSDVIWWAIGWPHRPRRPGIGSTCRWS